MTYSAWSLPQSPRTWSTKSKSCGPHFPLGESRNLSFEEPPPPPSPPLPEVGKVGGGYVHSTRGRILSGVRVNLKQTSHRNRFKCNPISSTNKDCKSCTESNCWHGCSPISVNCLPARKLQHFTSNWKLLTKDRWVLEAVQGYHTEFMSRPLQVKRPHPPAYPVEQTSPILAELRELHQKGAITELTTPLTEGFYSNLFLVPKKKEGSQRSIINLKALNQFIQA